MVVIALPFNCTMGPQSPMFLLNCYIRPYEKRHKILEVYLSLSFLACLFNIALWCSSSLSTPTSDLSIIGIMPLIGRLNSIVAGVGSPCPSGVVHFCNMAMCESLVESKCFFSVGFINFMQASTCPLLWWWYGDKNACSMFRLFQKVLNLSETKLLPESDIIFLGIPYSAKIILHVNIRLSADRSLVFLLIENLLW